MLKQRLENCSAGSSIESNARRIVSYLHSASSMDISLRRSARAYILSENFQQLCSSDSSEELHSQLLEHWQAAKGEDFEEPVTEGALKLTPNNNACLINREHCGMCLQNDSRESIQW